MEIKHTLSLLQYRNVISMFAGKALHESLGVESVIQSLLFLIATSGSKELFVCVEQAGEAPDKCSTNLIGVEGSITGQTHHGCTAIVDCQSTRGALVHAFLGLLVTNRTDQLLIPHLDLEEVTLNPASALIISKGLHKRLWHDCRCSNSRLCIHRRGVGGPTAVFRVQCGY